MIVMFHLWAGHAGCGGMLSTWLENLMNRVNSGEKKQRQIHQFQELKIDKTSHYDIIMMASVLLAWFGGGQGCQDFLP